MTKTSGPSDQDPEDVLGFDDSREGGDPPGRRPDFIRSPLALVVDGEEWTARSLESILNPEGYAVLKAFNGRQALELLDKTTPDLVLVSQKLPEMLGRDFCRRLIQTARFHRGTPILMLTQGAPSREERVEAYRSGVWEILHPPHDKEELLLRLKVFMGAKQEADRAREESLLDPETGFYNVQGLLKRAGEMAADAERYSRPLACVVLGGDKRVDSETSQGVEVDREDVLAMMPEELARLVSATVRLSDCVGRIKNGEYVIVAPGTDPDGARRLAERLLKALEGIPQEKLGALGEKIRAGYYAVPSLEDESPVPLDIVTRATLALRRAQGSPENRIMAYQDNGEMA